MNSYSKETTRLNRRHFIKETAIASGALVSVNPNSTQAVERRSAQPQSQKQYGAPPTLDLSPARWIWYPSDRCLQNTFVLFRRSLSLPQKPRSAKGWVLADSRYELLVNGQRVQWGPSPCDPRYLEADPLDLTDLLQTGENVIGAKVLFFGQGDGTSPLGKPGFIFRLEIETNDGKKETIVSDSSWNAHLCRAWATGRPKRWYLRSLQEEFDARLYPYGWSKAGFEVDRDWLPAMEHDCPANEPVLCSPYSEYMLEIQGDPSLCGLRPRSIPLLNEFDVPAEKLTESYWIEWLRPPWEYFDFMPPNSFKAIRKPCAEPVGENTWKVTLDGSLGAALNFELTDQVVGWPHFTIDAPAGTIIEMSVHEAHEPGGPAMLNTHYYSWTRFICKEGVNHFETFDFESMRWIQLHVHGVEGSVTISNVGVRRRMFPWPHQPQITCSEPALQRLFDAGINTLHNCAQETIVDGMARERQQYSGDCGHTLHAIYSVFGETRLPARYLSTFSQGITLDGYFLDCWPAYDRLARLMERQLSLTKWGPLLDHGIGLNFDCYHHYLYTGDLQALEEPFPRLLRFAEYLQSIIRSDGLLPVEDMGIPAVWIDHDAYRQQRHKQCAFNLYAAAMFEHALAPICEAFGERALKDHFQQLGRELVANAVRKFWSAQHGAFVNNLPWLGEEKAVRTCDRSLATSVLFDQCPEGDIKNTIKILADCPQGMGLSYPANAGWRLWALGKAGRVDVILNDFRKRWATMDSVILNKTLQEGWTAKKDGGSQWSHCPVAPLYVTVMNLAGIRPLEPAFKRCEIRPQLGDLEELTLSDRTVQGTIHFHAKGKPGNRELTLTIPAGCQAELLLDCREKLGLERVKEEGQLSRYRVESGKTFTIVLEYS